MTQMRLKPYTCLILLSLALLGSLSADEPPFDEEIDKCGHLDPVLSKLALQQLGDHWGYGYDSLLADLERWQESPYVQIDSLGSSVQGRAIWELMITGPDSTAVPNKQAIYIHARTHPNEVQAWWVTAEMIKLLLSESKAGRQLRDHLIFYIIPMYNPDGVELEYARQNANYVDIESNWYSSIIEPEVQVLRARFEELMNSPIPVSIALNMHSSYLGKRFFVCHDPNGTSPLYFEMEKRYISNVRSFFPEGIENWDFQITWSGGTPLRYPESWWWLNHQESVMALTYEDNNSSSASAFDTTAWALLNGSYEYLSGHPLQTAWPREAVLPADLRILKNSPNPFNATTHIQYQIPHAGTAVVSIFDLQGNKVATYQLAHAQAGTYGLSWQAVDPSGAPLASGIYICQLQQEGHGTASLKIMLTK